MENEQKVVQEQKVEQTKKEDIPDKLHRRIICHWGGEVDPEGFLSPYETVGYIHTYFNMPNFEGIKKHIDTLKFPPNQRTDPLKKSIVIDNGNWQLNGFDTREEVLGFLMITFSPQTINNMMHQAMNQVPVSLRKVKEIEMIFKAIYEILDRIEKIEKKLGEKNA